MLVALEELQRTTIILLDALRSSDHEKAFEAISIMLMQGIDFFGPNSTAMKQFFPVWDAIKSDIDRLDMRQAFVQAKIWDTQLREVISLVRRG